METEALNDMIYQLEKDKVIQKCSFDRGDYLNTVFLREKKSTDDGVVKYRIILNMKKLNKENVELIHHKMDSLSSCLNLMEKNCFMASIDLSNAFHTIPMHPNFTKYLKFRIGQQTYQYLVLPMGFRDSPRLFSKILKPVLAYLRGQGLLSSVYTDDFFLVGLNSEECDNNVSISRTVLRKCGFEFSDKSVFIPTQTLLHLGFILDSTSMTVSLGRDKQDNILNLANIVLAAETLTIRMLAKLIGTFIAALPGVEYGLLYYRELEFCKIEALKICYDFDKTLMLTNKAKEEITWWINTGIYSHKMISHGNPDIIIRCDSSGYAWGAETLHDNCVTQGFWDESEAQMHINVKELKAAMLGIQALCKEVSNCHIQIQTDNTTAVSYINKMGGTQSRLCNRLTKDLILWCINRKIWVSATHIPGVDNTSDGLSRKLNVNIEWSLNGNIFKQLCSKFGTPCIDLFATRINKKLPTFMSLHPDPEAYAINAFAHRWDSYAYIFPPFILIPRILRKIREDKTPKVLMIVPNWTVSLWYPKLIKMCLKNPSHLGNSPNLLVLPGKPKTTHPLFPKMNLLACLLSGKNIKDKD